MRGPAAHVTPRRLDGRVVDQDGRSLRAQPRQVGGNVVPDEPGVPRRADWGYLWHTNIRQYTRLTKSSQRACSSGRNVLLAAAAVNSAEVVRLVAMEEVEEEAGAAVKEGVAAAAREAAAS